MYIMATLTLEELGRMHGADLKSVKEHLRIVVEELNIPIKGNNYDALTGCFMQAGVEANVEGEGLDSHIVLGNGNERISLEKEYM